MNRTTFPITEQSNSITQDIDKANTNEILEQLHKCDLEIFNGWGGYDNVLSRGILSKLHEVSRQAAEYVKPNMQIVGIILSGCGTSGRTAFLISRKFNDLAIAQGLQPCYKYILSGGDHALMTSAESYEDNWVAGERELINEAQCFDRVLYIGITCGLSAPFVGGQIEYCLQHPNKFMPYLLGFNPAIQARSVAISGTRKVMLDMALEMKAKGLLINPIVGPEPITGSSRMKGGSATKMILETIFFTAHQLALKKPIIPCPVIINIYKRTLNLIHIKDPEISALTNMAGKSLVEGGSISYIAWGSLGIMGIIDAAECIPTFGACQDDIRCFLEGGYKFLGNAKGDLSSNGDALKIGFDHFMEKRCLELSEKDTVVFMVENLSPDQKLDLVKIAEIVKRKKVNLALIAMNTRYEELSQIQVILGNVLAVHIVLQDIKELPISYQRLNDYMVEMALKWVLNAVSTGAHIMKGKIVRNFMIDIKLTNQKLFERGVSIVASCGNVTSQKAKECLLQAIYQQDALSPIVADADVSEHVKKAGCTDKVVPLAILLTKKCFDINLGLKMLESCPSVRQCIDNCI